jgi:hypothetical protein
MFLNLSLYATNAYRRLGAAVIRYFKVGGVDVVNNDDDINYDYSSY